LSALLRQVRHPGALADTPGTGSAPVFVLGSGEDVIRVLAFGVRGPRGSL
jgi:hypothetical protein